MENKAVQVWLATDRHYQVPLLFTIHQIAHFEHSANIASIEVYFSDDVEEMNLRRHISSIQSTTPIPINLNRISLSEIRLPAYKYLTTGAWLRVLALHKTSFRGRVMFLDCDTLLMKGWTSIFELFNSKKKSIYAAQRGGHENFAMRFPCNGVNYYFNSGVMLFDLERWFELSRKIDFLEVISRYDALGFRTVDQDYLNFVIRCNYSQMPLEYNFRPIKSTCNPRIVHFSSGKKPWGFFQIRAKSDSKELFLKYRKEYFKFLFDLLILNFSWRFIFQFLRFELRCTVMNIKNRLRLVRGSGHIAMD